MTLQTGMPFDITDSGDRSLTGAGDDRPDYIGGDVQFVDPRANAFGLLNSYFNGTGGGTDTAARNPNFQPCRLRRFGCLRAPAAMAISAATFSTDRELSTLIYA